MAAGSILMLTSALLVTSAACQPDGWGLGSVAVFRVPVEADDNQASVDVYKAESGDTPTSTTSNPNALQVDVEAEHLGVDRSTSAEEHVSTTPEAPQDDNSANTVPRGRKLKL